MKTKFEKELERKSITYGMIGQDLQDWLDKEGLQFHYTSIQLRNQQLSKDIKLIELEKVLKTKEADDKIKKQKILTDIELYTYHTYSRDKNNRIVKRIIEKHL